MVNYGGMAKKPVTVPVVRRFPIANSNNCVGERPPKIEESRFLVKSRVVSLT